MKASALFLLIVMVPCTGSVNARATTHSDSPVLLHLRADSFDPLTGSDRITALPVLSEPKAAGDSSHGIVQFPADRTAHHEAVTEAGAEIVAYLPDNSYLVSWDTTSQSALRASGSFRFVGDYRPEWRVAPGLRAIGGADSDHPVVAVSVEGFPGVSSGQLCRLIAKRLPEAIIHTRVDSTSTNRCVASVNARQMVALYGLADSDLVMWMDRDAPILPHNTDSVGPIQSNSSSILAATLWDQDLLGTGQIIGVADSGLDRNEAYFTRWTNPDGDNAQRITDAEQPVFGEVGTLHPDNKVIGYFIQPGASAYDYQTQCGDNFGNYHGTHVSGTVAGDKGATATSTEANHDLGDGMAPHAQILFQDLGNVTTGCLNGVGGYDMFRQAFNAGATIHNNSYGSTAASAADDGYSFSDQMLDRATFEFEDMLIVVSAGNNGNDEVDLIGHPAQAKNALTVAALNHGNALEPATFTSTGNAADGRIKPDIAAPGVDIISAAGNMNNQNPPPAIAQPSAIAFSGTSMASPTVAGGAALMRQYYTDGFYPGGSRNTDDRMTPSGALMKATLLNGTLPTGSFPDIKRGWGRIWLDNNLYFAGDDRDLRLWDVPHQAGLETGDQHSVQVQVNAGQPFRATLVWFDPPASSASGRALVNDLDLEVVAPNGTFLGNVLSAGQSQTGGSRDALNPVEQVFIQAPQSGTYTLRVKATAVPGNSTEGSDRQGFALVASGSQCDSAVNAAPEITLSSDGGTRVDFSAVANAESYQIYRTEGNCSVDPIAQHLIGLSDGDSFIDLTATGGLEYAYRVRAADACGEGPISACQSAVSSLACSLAPQFDAASLTAGNLDSQTCGVTLSWSAAQASCSGTSVQYNLYRSTSPGFTPNASNRIAQGLTRTDYTDLAVDSFVTYYYAVRAEDTSTTGNGPNGGNETSVTERVSITTQSNTPTAGDFVDNAEGVVFSSLEAPWQVIADGSGGNLFALASGGAPYPDDTCAFLTTPPIQLQASGVASLSYSARYDLEVDFDGVVVQISNDGGASWTDLPPAGGYPGSLRLTQPNGGSPINACGFTANQGAFTGQGGAAQTFSSALGDYAGQTIQVRWAFTSDPNTTGTGFFLDDVTVSNASTPAQCTVSTLDTAALSGSWFNAGQSGHGWMLEVLDPIPGTTTDRFNAYWYVYLDGEQVWMTGAGDLVGQQATVDAFITEGPQFLPDYSSDDLTLTPWGQMRFEFSDEQTATASWSSDLPGFGSDSLAISKLAGIAESDNSCLSGTYFNSDQNGHGYVVEVIGSAGNEQVIVAWYVYRNGQQIWLFGLGPLVDGQAVVPVEIFNGPEFPLDYDASTLVRQDWGTLTLAFTGNDDITVSWQSAIDGFEDGSLDVSRLTTLKGHQCD